MSAKPLGRDTDHGQRTANTVAVAGCVVCGDWRRSRRRQSRPYHERSATDALPGPSTASTSRPGRHDDHLHRHQYDQRRHRPKTATKDTVAPSVLVNTVTNPITLNNETNASDGGTVEAVDVRRRHRRHHAHTTQPVTATVVGGSWTVSGINVSTLDDGTITFTATATDAAGNTATSSMTAAKNTLPPSLSISTVTNPVTLANLKSASISGTGDAGDTVSVIVGDGTHTTASKQTTVQPDGTWTISGIDLSTLKDGTITYTATATDTIGNSAKRPKPPRNRRSPSRR